MRIKPFKALFPDMDLVPSADSFFAVMKFEFPHYLKNSFFKLTSEPGYYIYEIKQRGQICTGIIASTSVKDIYDHKILKHENTIAKKEQQMLDLALQRHAMIKPVLLAHKHSKKLEAIYTEVKSGKLFLSINFEEEESEHKLWIVKNKNTIQKLHDIFKADVPVAYIADGHHRVSTGILLNATRKNTQTQFGNILSVYFSFKNLQIYDYNRVVSILKEISSVKLMAKLSKLFHIKTIKNIRKPKEKYEITMMMGEEAYSLKWKKKYLVATTNDEVILDARLLNKFVFDKIMKIKNVRTDNRISYIGGVEGIEGIKSRMFKDDYSVAFLLFPVSEKELKQIADKGSTLPPKSTWFEPRIKNAIISQFFE